MDDALNGRRVYAKKGPSTGGFVDASAEICNLSDTVAAASDPPNDIVEGIVHAAERKLILKDGRLLWLKSADRSFYGCPG